MRILIYHNFTEAQLEALRQVAPGHEVVQASNEEEASDLVPDAEVLMGSFPPPVFAAAKQLKWIQSFSAGLDAFLYPEVIDSDVVLSNMAGIYASQGGEHAWALLLALTRNLHTFMHNQDNGVWESREVVELRGGTLGVIGLGGFGLETAKRSLGYDMTIIAIDTVRTEAPDYVSELRPATRENLFDLLERSDVVSIGCPLTEETYHLISQEELAAMKKSAYLLNVTRGGIIDEPALADALKQGEIAGAGLDVCEKEPLAADSPLWNAPNLILTPHRAGFSQHRVRMVGEFACENLGRYLRGEELRNIVVKSRGY